MYKSLRLFAIWLISCQTIQATTIAEVFTIVAQYVKNPAQVGEVAPISQAAGQELAKFLGKGEVGKKYLEAGGGCGAVSICLAQKLRPQDHLDVIEIDPDMCEILKRRLQGYENVSVHCCSILDWDPGFTYDGIVSTLPFNSLGAEFAQQVIEYCQRVASRSCILSYVEYPICKQALQYFYLGERKRNFRAVQDYLESVRQNYLIEQAMIYFNVPPIAIYHLCLNQN